MQMKKIIFLIIMKLFTKKVGKNIFTNETILVNKFWLGQKTARFYK